MMIRYTTAPPLIDYSVFIQKKRALCHEYDKGPSAFVYKSVEYPFA